MVANCTRGGRGGAHRRILEQVEAGGAALDIATHENVICSALVRGPEEAGTNSCNQVVKDN
jgi:hypothetical protein